MARYELNTRQSFWIKSNPDKDDLRRFLIHGPVDTITVMDNLDIKVAGRLRGLRVTKPVNSMALALKEAEAIRDEYIKAGGMIPLDEEDIGIHDTPKQRLKA